ncbi:MAG: stage III sporulation protein AB [Clostridia bacterium]|nr:stage III sporulation protein AB [Clostridia bacterium]
MNYYFAVLGYTLVFLCPSALGYIAAFRTKEQVLKLDGIISMIEHIRYEIGERMTPQNMIFERFENRALSRCGFLDILKKSRSDGENSSLKCALVSYGKLFPEDAKCEMLINDFSLTLGTLSRQEQQNRCTEYIERLRHIYTEKSGKISADTKLYRSLGLLLGTVSVLLLL